MHPCANRHTSLSNFPRGTFSFQLFHPVHASSCFQRLFKLDYCREFKPNVVTQLLLSMLISYERQSTTMSRVVREQVAGLLTPTAWDWIPSYTAATTDAPSHLETRDQPGFNERWGGCKEQKWSWEHNIHKAKRFELIFLETEGV